MTTDTQQLDELQAWLGQQIRSLRHLPSQPEVAKQAAAYLTGNDRLSPVEQLEIYRVQFWLRHTSALLEDFPGVSGILGQAEWEKLVESYFESFVPESWTLRDVGDRLEAHIRARPDTPHQALCADMAALEWSYVEIFDAEDTPSLSLEKLQSFPPSAWMTAKMVLSPALRMLELGYPVAELRKALKSTHQQETVPIPEQQGQYLVVYRGSNRNLFNKALSREGWQLLTELQHGTPLAAACEVVASTSEEAAQSVQANIGAWFQQWGSLGWIVDVVSADAD